MVTNIIMENKKKLKILAASDLHGDSFQVMKLADRAEKENVDLVVLCGDITSPLETKNIIKPFKDKGKKVLLVPGNHDGLALGDFLADLYNVKNLHGKYAKYYHVGFFGCGGANVGLDALSDEETFEVLKKGFYYVKGSEKRIMVTHVHPEGTIVDKMFPRWGSKGVRKAIDILKPDLLLCGHVHEAEGVEDLIGNTKVVNVGRNGKIIEI
ncbi:metallophosphoesterase family protein [Candidatus Woesearchaeota archaeon]|nr:metallophosphoesterase family protein [Candidatus Woesearchaeota archaeon]